ncbi:MAG: hypothetical protein PHQ33_06900, partial [Bacteroidales bacterium]|nr:hypothetical protein [Bacteroidales bacterium]
GDFSTLSTNPAGIGLYKKSEISFTPIVITSYKTKSSFLGGTEIDRRVRYSLTNFGMVFSANLKKLSGLKMLQFGFGYNRINDFNSNTYASGKNFGTMATSFADIANGTSYDDLSGDAYSAWNTWLIDTLNGSTDQYYSILDQHNLQQSSYIKTSGGIDEMTFSFGGNYEDKLFLGMTIGVPFLDYTQVTEYSESDDDEEINAFNSYTVNDNLHTNGVGINAKIGIIYQPVKFMRIGFAFHTPTFYNNLKENFEREIVSDFEDEKYSDSYENISKYKLSTPLRFMGSLGFLIAKRAFISAEYEFVDYSMASLMSSDIGLYRYSFKDENKAIGNKYGISHTLRIGGELTVTDFFLIRLGYAYSSSPYKESYNDGSSHNISGGIGFRSKTLFLDLAYVYRITKDNFWFYESETLAPVSRNNMSNRFAATFGVKF